LAEYSVLKIFSLYPEKRVCSEIFHCIDYIFYRSGFLSNLRLPWKTEFVLKFFTALRILLHSGFLSNLRLPWKTELPWKFSLYWNTIVIQDF